MTTEQDDLNELRTLKRRHLIYYLEVFNQESGELLGHLVDLTTEGIKLVSRDRIASGQTFSMKMIMPEEVVNERHIEFQAKSLWCRPDVNPDFYATGFNAPDLDEKTRKLFQHLIEQVGFND